MTLVDTFLLGEVFLHIIPGGCMDYMRPGGVIIPWTPSYNHPFHQDLKRYQMQHYGTLWNTDSEIRRTHVSTYEDITHGCILEGYYPKVRSR